MCSLPLLTPAADHRLWESSSGLSNAETLFDVELVTRDGTYTEMVHSFMLAVHSRYFAAVLKEGRKGDAGPVQRVRIDLNRPELRTLREFIYTGRICDLSFDKAQDVTKIADLYMLPGLMTYCAAALLENVTKENCINMYKFAHFYHSWDLANAAYSFALRNIWSMVHADDATEFCQLDNQELYLLLSNDRLDTPTEAAVFDVIWKWIRAAPDHRMQYMTSLLGTIRYGLIPEEEWKVLYEKVGQCDKFSQQLLVTHRRWPSNTPILWYTLESVGLRPRIPTDVLFCIGGWSSGTPTSKMEVYDPKVNRWFECPSVDNTPRAYHGTAVLNGSIYIIAGYDAVEYFASTRKFDPRTRQWSETSPMYTKRCYVNVAVHNGLIYAVGGYDGSHRHNTVERYDPNRNQWSMIAPMHNVRSDASAAFLDGKLYVAGGFDGQQVTATVERYDPETNSWTMVRDMHTARSGVSLIAHEGHLYVLGGFDGRDRLDSMERYSPGSNTWKQMPAMHSRRSNFSVAAMHNFLYVAGGYNGSTTIPDAERYDVTRDRWEKIQPMLCDRSALKICVFPNLPNSQEYTFHGCYLTQPREQRQRGDALATRNFRPPARR